MSIQAIDRSSIHRLTSGQVVIDLQTAVKELVENALDAGATSIKITFRDHGLEAIEVEDNGKGIEQGDWEGIALKHHTSKLTSFADLALVSTLGFRGEALSSLCGTASLSMHTATASSAPVGTQLTFTPAGECVVGGKAARNKGTTVKVERLFENLPVRRKELQKNAKREFGKALELVQAYAIINVGVRFEVRNALQKRAPQIHLQTPAAPSLRSTFSCVYTPKALPSLLDLDLTLEVATEKSVLKRIEGATDGATTVRIKGLISKPSTPHGRTSGSRQFYYVNGRPFNPSKVAKAVNEVYKSFNSNQFPTVVADFQLATDAYDVNVSPDKRTIFLHSEGNLISALKTALEAFFQPSQATYAMTQIGPAKGSSSSAAASPAGGSPAGSQRTGKESRERGERGTAGGGDGEEGAEEERPRKRRKSSPAVEDERAEDATAGAAPTLDEKMDAAGDDKPQPISSDACMDVELDASFLTVDSGVDLSEPDQGAVDPSGAFPDLERDLDLGGFDATLPEPPSPIRRAQASSEAPVAGPSSPRAPSRLHSETPAAAARESAQPETGPSSPRLPTTDSTPLFRASPSPSLAPAPSARARSASPMQRSPSPPRAPLIPPNLRQPTLNFGAAPSSSSSSADAKSTAGASSAKGKGKAKARDPAEAMRGRLKQFLRGSQVGTGDEEQEEEEEEQVAGEGEEQEQEEREEDEGGEAIVQDSQGASNGADDGHEALVDILKPDAATAAASDDDDEPLEIVSASCACAHGSPHDHAPDADDDDSDLEIEDVAPTTTAGKEADEPAPVPFGSAPAEVAGTFVAADTTLAFDLSALEAQWARLPPASSTRRRKAAKRPAEDDDDALAGAGIGEKESEAEATLSRVVSKADFGAMEVLGQFNLGFIIARRRVEGEGGEEVQDDLFIVDQHASDEKYNFEKLQRETEIQSQRLLAPRVLSLPSHDEITAMEHLDLLRLNGFDVLVDEDADVGERVKLIAQPVSKDTVFDVGDFEELLDLINARSGSEVVRPSKARRMFASRACRKSVMIGRALNVKQMTSIVRHMGEMDQPWACPHGRPTMRWLFGLGGSTSLSSSSSRDSRSDLSSILASYE
ncbi:hypothetical protein JCM10207_006944 [Rhodosporidiobolus poonsookiae]